MDFSKIHGPGVVSVSSENEYQEHFPGGKGGQCVRLTTSPTSCAEFHEVWEPKTPGTLWATPGLLRDCFTILVRYSASQDILNRVCNSKFCVFVKFKTAGHRPLILT